MNDEKKDPVAAWYGLSAVLLIPGVILTIAAIWTSGLTSQRLAETAFLMFFLAGAAAAIGSMTQ